VKALDVSHPHGTERLDPIEFVLSFPIGSGTSGSGCMVRQPAHGCLVMFRAIASGEIDVFCPRSFSGITVAVLTQEKPESVSFHAKMLDTDGKFLSAVKDNWKMFCRGLIS
jgi:hypothetical protein